jgi:hypothetical protein
MQPTWSRPLEGGIAEGGHYEEGFGDPPQLVSSSLLKLLQAGTEAGTSSPTPTSQDGTQQLGAAGVVSYGGGLAPPPPPAPGVPGPGGCPRVVPLPVGGHVVGGHVIRQLSDPTSSGAQTRQSSNPLIFDLAALDLTDPAVLARLDTAGSAGPGPGSHLARGRAAASRSPGHSPLSPGVTQRVALNTGGPEDHGHGGLVRQSTGGHGPPTALSLMQANSSGAGQSPHHHHHQQQSQLQQQGSGRLLLMRAHSGSDHSRSSIASSVNSRASSLARRLRHHRSLSGAQLHLGRSLQLPPGPSTAPVPGSPLSVRSMSSSDGGHTNAGSAPPSPLSRGQSGALVGLGLQ